MSIARDRSLIGLLPAIYSLRDQEQNGPLAALLSVIGEQVAIVGKNLDQLYGDMFIETCQPWVVPYLGDLVDVRPAESLVAIFQRERLGRAMQLLSPRREVADAIKFERRKGTLAVLEDLAQAVANWPARAVEYYAQVNTFQSARHPAADMGRTVDVRQRDELAKVGTPFNTVNHLIDSRTLDMPSPREFENQGLFHIRHVGLQIWRLISHPITQATPRCLCSLPIKVRKGPLRLQLFAIDSLGLSTPLSIRPTPESDPLSLAEEKHVPGPLTLAALQRNPGDFYGPDKSLQIWTQTGSAEPQPIPVEQLIPCDLSWLQRECCRGQSPRSHRLYCKVKRLARQLWRVGGSRVAIDPEHGLIAIVSRSRKCRRLRVSYHANFPADLGGGEYERPRPVQPGDDDSVVWRIRRQPSDQNHLLAPTGSELGVSSGNNGTCFSVHPATGSRPAVRVIEIADSATYQLEACKLMVPAGVHLEIRAAVNCRPTLDLKPVGNCETALTVVLQPGSRFQLNGLRVSGGALEFTSPPESTAASPPHNRCGPATDCGQVAVQPVTPPPRVDIRHCTLMPEKLCGCCGRKATPVHFQINGGRLAIEHSIVGSVRVTSVAGAAKAISSPARLSIDDSIVDGRRAHRRQAIAGDAMLRIARATVLGGTCVREIDLAADSIFTKPVKVARQQVGGMRFCYVPPNHRRPEPTWLTPQQYYCQPAQTYERAELNKDADCGRIDLPEFSLPWQQIRPRFTSRELGQPAFCQLRIDCPVQISAGAEDGAEMGAFHDLYQPQRAAALQRRLEQFTPLSLQASLLYVT